MTPRLPHRVHPSVATTRIASALLLAALAACSTPSAGPPVATAQLQPKSGSSASGTVTFAPQGDRVRVVARVSGLTPNQEHGFHVHEKGDCSSADAMSAGGHFNPTAQPHGAPAMAHHGGDMPSLKADADGRVDTSFFIDGVTIGSGSSTDLAGKAVIVHEKPDDYTTQPTGNSGGRIACGVIGAGSTAR
jgi:superoxide dismutase, Cu-Zn family